MIEILLIKVMVVLYQPSQPVASGYKSGPKTLRNEVIGIF